MPLPPDTDTPTETVDEPVSLEFSRVECLLYIFHQLAKHHKEFLADNPERLKDFRLRLVHMYLCTFSSWIDRDTGPVWYKILVSWCDIWCYM